MSTYFQRALQANNRSTLRVALLSLAVMAPSSYILARQCTNTSLSIFQPHMASSTLINPRI